MGDTHLEQSLTTPLFVARSPGPSFPLSIKGRPIIGIMNPIQSLIRTSAPASRSFTSTFTSSARNSFKTSQFQSAFRQSSKRWASDAAGTGATAGGATGSGAPNAAKESWLKRMWNSPVGIKTVHFWAPVMKVCVEHKLGVSRERRHGQLSRFVKESAWTDERSTEMVLY